MFKKLILSFFIETVLIVQCSLLCACGNESCAARSIEDLVVLFTRVERGSDGIANFGLTKSDEAGYKNLQLLENRSKELQEFSPIALKHITTNDDELKVVCEISTKDPRLKAIVEFLKSPEGDALKTSYRQLYGLALCCVHQKLQNGIVSPFDCIGVTAVPKVLKQAIEQCINRLSNAIKPQVAEKVVLAECNGSRQQTIGGLFYSDTLMPQARVAKALNGALREIGLPLLEDLSMVLNSELSQIGQLVKNPSIGTIFCLCAQQDYVGALDLLNKSFESEDMLTLKFKNAFEAFIRGNYEKFDPQIGDELCEVRALLVPLLREGCKDLPCLNMLLGARQDVGSLVIFSSYLLTLPLPGISSCRGSSVQFFIDQLCGKNGFKSRLPEGSYAAFKKFLSAVSIAFLRDVVEASGDADLMLGCNNVFINSKGCLTMPFYCSIKALDLALKKFNVPVIFRVMKVEQYKQESVSGDDFATGPCCYVMPSGTQELKKAALIYECKNVPSGVVYKRSKLAPRDKIPDDEFGVFCSQMIRLYGLSNIILQDAAQHDQLINPSKEMLEKMSKKLDIGQKVKEKVFEQQALLKLFSQCGKLARDYEDCIARAKLAKMDEGRKGQSNQFASLQEEINLLVVHVFASDAQSYLSQRLGNKMQAGRRACCL